MADTRFIYDDGALRFIYDDPDPDVGTRLDVDADHISIDREVNDPDRPTLLREGLHVATPKGEDAVAFVRAVLANPAPGDVRYVVIPEWQVIDPAELTAEKRAYAKAVARSMRNRAYEAAYNAPGTPHTPTEAIRALPLLPDGGDTVEEVPQPNYGDTPAGRAAIDRANRNVVHRALRDAKRPHTPDFRVHLVAEALGEDRETAADMLADDPDGVWERVYAIWHLEQGRLDEYRRGKDPVVDRVAQLERDQGHTEKRLDALERTERERRPEA